MVVPKRQAASVGSDNLAHSLLNRPLAVRGRSQQPHQRSIYTGLLQERLSRQLPSALRPTSYGIGAYNKIFACDWLDRDTVLLATKCSQLLRLSLLNNDIERIPLLGLPSPPGPSAPAGAPIAVGGGPGSDGGVHALELNPPATFLAAGARTDGDLGVYELPSMRPYALLHGAHSDWVFDAAWLDPATLVSVSRDSSLAVWGLPVCNFAAEVDPVGFTVTSPRYQRQLLDLHGRPGVRLRSVDVGQCGSVAVLSLNCFLHFYSTERLDTPVTCVELGTSDCSLAKETVCVRASSEPHCFFSCCVDQVTMYDCRVSPRSGVFSVESRDKSSGVRSLACNGPVLSYGTGVGNVYFYDCRSRRHLRSRLSMPRRGANEPDLRTAPLQQFRDHNYLQQHAYNVEYAVYSHKYDANRMRIFTAGGPLATSFWGNLAVLHS